MPTPDPAPRVLVRAAERGPAFPSGHPYNPRSEVHGWLLSRPAGLRRVAVNLGLVPPGKETAVFHVHHREEEWGFVVAGRGVLELEGREEAVGPGDFFGFPAGTAHHLRNAGPEPLQYLVGGEILPDAEVADFPRLRRRLVRFAGFHLAVYPWEAELPFVPAAAAEAMAALFGLPPGPGPAPRVLVRAGERGPAERLVHPLNPRSEAFEAALAAPAGLRRLAVNHVRLPPGKESFAYHRHHAQEEWLFVLAGRGVAEVGDAAHEVGPGDYLGFPAGGPAHHLRNDAGEDLVYLAGGDASGGVEVVDFPRLGRRKVWLADGTTALYPLTSGDAAPR